MEHAEAVKLNAVERYLLGELTAPERDAFEEHYFECADCAAEVKAGAAFIDNVRETLRRSPATQGASAQRENRRSWFGWLQPGYALAAAAVLVLAIAYQTFVTIPRIKHGSQSNVAQALPTLSLTTSGSRSQAGVPEIAIPRHSPFGIFIDIPTNERFTSYLCVIRDKDGNTKHEINVSGAQARDMVELFIPGGALDSGFYQVVIVGNKSTHEPSDNEEIARYPFSIKNVR